MNETNLNNVGATIAKIEKMTTIEKPKYRFCWHCGKQLRANFYQEFTDEHGYTYIVHRQCKEVLDGKLNLEFDNL